MRKRGRPKGHEQTAKGLTQKKVKKSNKPVSFLKVIEKKVCSIITNKHVKVFYYY